MPRRHSKRLNSGPVVLVAKLLTHTIVAVSVISIVTILQSSDRVRIVSGQQELGGLQFSETIQDSGGDNSGEDGPNNEAASEHVDQIVVASGAAANQNKHSQCEPIKFPFCASMEYNFARQVNFFGDANQIEAADRARQYERLVATQCSRHLLAYLCELLAPMCLDDEAMKKFDIYPCRSFCRHVSNECAKQITALYTHHSLQVPAAFACDRLPYESNGGTGILHGPCHDTPESNTTSRANNYKPYRKEPDPNIADNSPIDPKIIRPVQPLPVPPIRGDGSHQDQSSKSSAGSSLWAQLQQFGQQLAWGLMKHSNLISVLTLICLVLVLNAKRLKRAHNYLAQDCCPKSSTSSSSSRKSSSSASSSVGSELKLSHKMMLSPSNSSRSLMLFAGCDGKRSKPSNKLISEHRHLQQQQQQQQQPHRQQQKPLVGMIEQPQNLLHQAGLGQRTTLINVNGTLERQQQNSPAARYHLIQSLNNQHLAIMANAENSGKQHQYDYIQVPVGQKQHQQQQQHIYSGSCSTELMEPSNYKRYQCQSLQDSFRSATSVPPAQRKSSSKTSSGGQLAQNEPQLYSNILLSSPSHQILLFGDESTPRQFSGDSTSVGAGARRGKWSKQWAHA